MNGTLSHRNSGSGVSFYRVIAMSAAAGNFVFAVFFIFFYPQGRELIWDRLFFVAFSLVLIFASKSEGMSSARYAKWVTFLFYSNTAMIILAVARNNFDAFYFLSLLITIQVFSFSFRNENSTFWYLIFVCVISLAGLLFISVGPQLNKGLICSMVVLTCTLQYLSARVKCRFMGQMKMSQDLLKSLFSKSEDAIFLTDIHGNINDINLRAIELFGFSRDEILDQDFKIVRKLNLTEEELKVGLIELETNRFWTTETVLVKKDGEEFPARLSITLIKNALNRFLVYRVLDITSIKENEAKLIEARDKAEEAVMAKSQFLAVMSHEIRTPLNGVIATASIIQNTELDFAQMEYVQTIKKSGQSLLMLINDILEFSKMENNKMDLDPEPGKLDEAVFDVTDLLRPHAEAKGIELEVSIDSSIKDYFMLDFHRLKQVLFNLIGNSVKFTPSGKVIFIVHAPEINLKKAMIRFEVRDTGIGMPADKMHLLFQSFSQIDSSTSRKYGGTGLGLAISKQLIELMGGKIEVESEEGVGTTFRFNIQTEIATEEQMQKCNAPLQEDVKFDYSSIHVLVAEDNEINKQVLKFILDSLNVKTDFANDGKEAIEMCRAKNYDLIFMDMNMPNLDGVQATIYIREHFNHQPAVIAITANTFEEDQKRCREAGMNDFLGKPFELEQLKKSIRTWCPKGNSGVSSAA